ncbi:MAG: hypothetical protein IT172_03820 [Acidobacteria bacterium]|nr:hypothetical protein [Acidobacteriota bacterium]
MYNGPIQTRRDHAASDPVRYAQEHYRETAEILVSKDAAAVPAEMADILEYPRADWAEKLEQAKHSTFAKADPDGHFADFCNGIEEIPLTELQELYTRSFDLNPACALEIGYHLFGEDYKRGAFLASLRETQEGFDLGQEQQLPDHLPVLLRMIRCMDDDDLRGSLINLCLIPGLEKIIKKFKEVNPYLDLIKATAAALRGTVSATAMSRMQAAVSTSTEVSL